MPCRRGCVKRNHFQHTTEMPLAFRLIIVNSGQDSRYLQTTPEFQSGLNEMEVLVWTTEGRDCSWCCCVQWVAVNWASLPQRKILDVASALESANRTYVVGRLIQANLSRSLTCYFLDSSPYNVKWKQMLVNIGNIYHCENKFWTQSLFVYICF